MQVYFLPTHGNGEVPVLEKLPYGLTQPSSIVAKIPCPNLGIVENEYKLH
jgi:hypothetical protein